MSGFNHQSLEKKLNEFNSSQQSIQTLSLWLIHHRKHYKTIVQIWFKELKKAKTSRRLPFMYLANDVIQNSRKKGPEFSKEFLNVLGKCFEYISREIDQPTLNSLDRLLKIWEERNIYEKNHLKTFRQLLHSTSVNNNNNNNNDNNENDSKNGKASTSKELSSSTTTTNNDSTSSSKNSKKRELELDSTKGNGHLSSNKKFQSSSTTSTSGSSSISTLISDPNIDTDALNNIMSKIGSLIQSQTSTSIDTTTTASSSLSSASNLIPPPQQIDLEKLESLEPESLIKILKNLEQCASADEDTRKKIAQLPTELFDVKQFEKILEKDFQLNNNNGAGGTSGGSSGGNLQAQQNWLKLISDAQNLLTTYNQRLANELEERKQLTQLLLYFIELQRRSLTKAEQNLNEYRDKLRKVLIIREELNSHLKNLPDLSQLPSMVIKPLPSPLDLFKK